ncbi:1852_t:CDS:2, partial [Acaulospora morrowiae]
GISFISANNACRNAEMEVGEGWDFEKVRKEAEEKWEIELEKIAIQGGSDKNKKIFYSGLYRSMILPSDRTGENPRWRSYDSGGNLIPYYDDIFTLRVVDIARSLIDIYENEGFMPDGRSGMYNSIARGGSNGDLVLSELFLKNLGKGKIDWNLGYKAMLKNALAEPWSRGSNEGRMFLRFYKEYGYLPLMKSFENWNRYRDQGMCSKTMEYTTNDFAIACVAKGLKKKDDYERFIQRSNYWRYLWDSNTTVDGVQGFIRPIHWGERDKSLFGVFRTSTYTDFYEGSFWEYSLNVPHDVNMLIKYARGPREFEKRLDTTFSNKGYNNNYFSIQHIPSLFHPNLYHYIGKQYKSVQVIRDIMKKKFGTGKNGLPGHDESGVYSCWYIFNAIGIYPIGGQDIYLINSPHFTNTTIYLSPTITFSILANNLNSQNIYIQSAKLNGRDLKNTWFRHGDISKGGILELEMGNEISKVWGVLSEDTSDAKEWFGKSKIVAPPSASD